MLVTDAEHITLGTHSNTI